MLTFDIVLPVKPLAVAKSRLVPAVEHPTRSALARAFALDTLDAALAARRVARVIVVGDLSSHFDALPPRVSVVAEPEPRSLRAAVRHGISVARRVPQPGTSTAPDGWPRGVAVLLGDQPALTAPALDAALECASRHPLAFMPDADATGTTLATAVPHTVFEPAFGTDSAAAHRTAGFHDLSHDLADDLARFVRQDVDTVEALDRALRLGVGAHTAAVISTFADAALAARRTRLHRHLDPMRKGAA